MSQVTIESEDGSVIITAVTDYNNLVQSDPSSSVTGDGSNITVENGDVNVEISNEQTDVVTNVIGLMENIIHETPVNISIEHSNAYNGFADAPADSVLYGRLNNAWSEAGDMRSLIYDPFGEDIDTFQLENMRGNLDGGTF